MSYFDILAAKAGAGGGTPTPPPVLIEKSVTQNGTYTAADDEADGYSSVAVNVPNTYAAGDEGKVVQNGSLVSQTSTSVSQNGTINTTTNNSVTVNVPNTYTQADEGKVVSNGALVAQTAYPSEITANDTYDTTNYNSITVNVPAAGGAAYYTRYKATSSTSTLTSLGFGIFGDKGTEGSIFVAIDGLVSTSTFSPNNPLVLTDFTLSDYLTSNITMTVRCNTNDYFSLTFDVANNQLSFSQGNFIQATAFFSGFKTTTL